MLLGLIFLWHLIVPGMSEILSCASSTTMPSPNIQAWSLNKGSSDLEFSKTSACIFKTQSNCSFTVSLGPKFVRLHFYPISYPGLSISKALFNVSIGSFTLLSVSKSSYGNNASGVENIIKEYCVVVDDYTLNILFTPSSDYPDAYGFVNMIEVVSVPRKLYLGELRLPIIGQINRFSSMNYTALETLYRVNIGGSAISAVHDSGMSRSWSGDQGNGLFPNTQVVHLKNADIDVGSEVQAYAAPMEVYTTARQSLILKDGITWSLPVDSGFIYLIRFHLYMPKSTNFNDENRIIVHIHTSSGASQAETRLIQEMGVPMYRDFLVNLSREHQGEVSLFISMQQNIGSGYSVPSLNGLEIFKLSNENNSLAGPNPFKPRNVPSSASSPKILWIVFCVLLTVVSLILSAIYGGWVVLFLQLRWRSFLKWKIRTAKCITSSKDCPHFTLAEIKLATENFSDAFLLGSGGFGKVYKGCIIDGNTFTTVTIKRLNPKSHQGINEFQTEIAILSKVRHCHLISLIGCCMEANEMIIVYSFMEKGTLADHLYKTKESPLPWKKRLKICIDENWEAKVSDFGLSKIGPNMTMTESETHVSTLVKGSFGYLDPEYYRQQKLTEKSDVYSFGVVLFEVLFARPAVLQRDKNEDDNSKVSLADWALNCYQTGTLDENIDPFLHGKINPECFKTFTDIGMKCLEDKGSERPTMGEVLCDLELAWRQELKSSTTEASRTHKRADVRIQVNLAPTIYGQRLLPTDISESTPGVEFSEIMFPTGR
ncbi:putative Malectin/receptor protein kinase family protein [Hibiscus syriacus]|uniref:Malectin/receptor protein kinase family protein n=1 Tax=Hibiscus syriacus TaxID=106335 RepID=A0A6A2WAC8_HIBSY|nr:putative Malectin/receptor protein kinase family protein [Hibiscus syriacus]